MHKNILVETDRYRLTSYGNGLAYVLTNVGNGKSIFVQGDDAESFRQEWTSLENNYPDTDTNYILADLFDQYAGTYA